MTDKEKKFIKDMKKLLVRYKVTFQDNSDYYDSNPRWTIIGEDIHIDLYDIIKERSS